MTDPAVPPVPPEPQPAQPRYGEYSSQPMPAAVPQGTTASEPPAAPAGTKPYTLWIWLFLFVPLLSLGSLVQLATLDWGSLVAALPAGGAISPQDQLELQQRVLAALGPGYAVSTILGILVDAAIIVFAWLDWRELSRRGVPSPFHWAWAFLVFVGGYYVYAIGRIVVVRRRLHAGFGVLWALIAVFVVSVVVSIVFVGIVFSEVFNAIATQFPAGSGV